MTVNLCQQFIILQTIIVFHFNWLWLQLITYYCFSIITTLWEPLSVKPVWKPKHKQVWAVDCSLHLLMDIVSPAEEVSSGQSCSGHWSPMVCGLHMTPDWWPPLSDHTDTCSSQLRQELHTDLHPLNTILWLVTHYMCINHLCIMYHLQQHSLRKYFPHLRTICWL